MVLHLRKMFCWMQTLLSRAFIFFICAFITEKRANVAYAKIFNVFVSDWLKILINIHEEIVALAANQAGRVCVNITLKL